MDSLRVFLKRGRGKIIFVHHLPIGMTLGAGIGQIGGKDLAEWIIRQEDAMGSMTIDTGGCIGVVCLQECYSMPAGPVILQLMSRNPKRLHPFPVRMTVPAKKGQSLFSWLAHEASFGGHGGLFVERGGISTVTIVAEDSPLIVYALSIFYFLLTVADHTGIGFFVQHLSLSRLEDQQN